MEKQVLKSIFLKEINLTDKEFEDIATFFKKIEIKKKEHLVVAGRKTDELAFVISGALYSSIMNVDGEKTVIRFAFENNMIGDLNSFFTGECSVLNVIALEDTLLMAIKLSDLQVITEKYPAVEKFLRILIQNLYIQSQNRLFSMINQDAKERYLHLLKSFPNITQRAPQSIIASYLGIKVQSLSRIRKRLFS